jgi:hypothetical protein
MLFSGNDEVVMRRKQYIKEYRKPKQVFSRTIIFGPIFLAMNTE